jgi:hypothetical protein
MQSGVVLQIPPRSYQPEWNGFEMGAKPIPSQETLLQLLRCDPEAGLLFWRARSVDIFPAKTPARSECMCRLWNSRYADKEALTCISDGYKTGAINGTNFKAHRIIWKMVHGEDPDQIDHINGDRVDNRLANLRSVDLGENSRNRARPRSNTSGIIGVYFWTNGTHSYWVAHCGKGRQQYFATKPEAAACRAEYERSREFHPNHGR